MKRIVCVAVAIWWAFFRWAGGLPEWILVGPFSTWEECQDFGWQFQQGNTTSWRFIACRQAEISLPTP